MKKNILFFTLCLCLLITAEAFANALVDAAGKGNISAVKNFLDNRGYDINSKDKNGNTALMAAVKNERERMVKFLLSRGININAKNKLGITALGLAARIVSYSREDHPERMVKLLIQRGANVNTLDNQGDTILTEICSTKAINMDSVKILLENGIIVNDQEKKGSSALSYAVMWGYSKLAAMLVQFNAHLDVKDEQGYTPLLSVLSRFADLETAADGEFMGNTNLDPEENAKMAELFLENGADANARAYDGQTPLKLAKQSRNADMIRLVRRYGAR